jgi:hypothetical protein
LIAQPSFGHTHRPGSTECLCIPSFDRSSQRWLVSSEAFADGWQLLKSPTQLTAAMINCQIVLCSLQKAGFAEARLTTLVDK